MEQVRKYIVYTLIFYALIGLIYWTIVRPAYFNWGATKAEIGMKLPGDKFIPPNTIVSTRAININAPRESIFPWIVQTGQNRAGFNSYSWLENIFAARMVNAHVIHPEWQATKPGDTVYYGKNQYYDLVRLVKQNEYYSLNGWMFFLQPLDASHTRLIVRYPSMEVKQHLVNSFYYYSLFESLHFTMEAGMMMGIKQRAENLNRK